MMHILKHLYTKIDFKRSSLHRSAQYPSASTTIQKTTMTTRICLSFILLFTIFSLTSCADNDLLFVASDTDAITFGTGRATTSRAADEVVNVTVTDIASLKENGFGVCAYYTGSTDWNDRTEKTKPNFMDKVKVSYDNDSWIYSPIKFWPRNSQEKISYFAYAPYTASDYLYTTNGDLLIDYDIVDDEKDIKTMRMWDLVVAKNIDVTGKSISDNDKTIKFAFKHVTSKVFLNAKLGDALLAEGAQIYVTGLYVFGLYATAKYNLTEGEWQQIEVADSIDFTKRTNLVSPGYKANSQTQIKGFPVIDGNLTNIFMSGMPNMYVIPQLSDVHLKFEYYIISDNDKDENGYYKQKTAMLNLIRDFKAGNIYKLNFSFDTGGITLLPDDNETDEGGNTVVDPYAPGGEKRPYYLHVTNSTDNVEGDIWNGLKDKYIFKAVGDGTYKLSLDALPYQFQITVADTDSPSFSHCTYGTTYTTGIEYNFSKGNILLEEPYYLDNDGTGRGVGTLYIEDADKISNLELIFDPEAGTLTVTGTPTSTLSYDNYYIYGGSYPSEFNNAYRLSRDTENTNLYTGTFDTLNSGFYIRSRYIGYYYGSDPSTNTPVSIGKKYTVSRNRASSKVGTLQLDGTSKVNSVKVYFNPSTYELKIVSEDQWGDKFLYIFPKDSNSVDEAYQLTYQGNGVYTGTFDVSALNATGFYIRTKTSNWSYLNFGAGYSDNDQKLQTGYTSTLYRYSDNVFTINTNSIQSSKVKITVRYKDSNKSDYSNPTINEATITAEAL